MIASLSGCHDDWKIEKTGRAPTIDDHRPRPEQEGQHGERPHQRADLERPRPAEADVGQVAPDGDRDGERDGAERGEQPDLARREAERLARMTETNG